METFPIRQMTPADAEGALNLSLTMGAGQSIATWTRLLELCGEGAFCIDGEAGQLLATATAICYGDQRAWIGMVVVHPDHRGRGLGRQSMDAIMDYLHKRGIREIMLDASAMGRPLYEKMGFRPLCKSHVWRGTLPTSTAADFPTVRLVQPSDLPFIIALDARCFGVERPALMTRFVQDFAHSCWVEENAGCIIAQPNRANYVYLSTWLHENAEGAERLFKTALAAFPTHETRVDVAGEQPVSSALLTKAGLQVNAECTRMIYGDAVPDMGQSERYFGIAGMPLG